MTENREEFTPGVNISENMIFSCFGCMSNTGLIAGIASIEAINTVGLKKAGIGCLAAFPLKSPTVMGKTKASKHVVTIDGCESGCARKLVEQAGFKPISIMLQKDLGIKKFSLSRDIPSGNPKKLSEYIVPDQVAAVRDYIVNTIATLDKENK